MNNIRRNIKALVSDVTGRRLPRAMRAALHEAGVVAALYTPIDTSTLDKLSVSGSANQRHTHNGRIGYSANYAIYVADPNIPQPSGA
ncbi:Uncharacterised protein [Klebsiella pneumoniae]|uniref:Uncharacterized protein n=1 Tax=Klebsiella pneumoniae TaxID=573 RepID=A0A377XUD4_KLEPN|nr:Uncharacterised protein [Klebsiella pneumoniae]